MKDFLVLGRCTAMGYKDINGLILDGRMWFGCTETGKMIGGDVHCYWFTNLVGDKVVEFIPLTRKYEEGMYKKMDNYNAINIDSIYDIPSDYDGVMAVPVTFLNRWNKEQFEVLDCRDYTDDWRLKKSDVRIINLGSQVDGIQKFTRILIKRKNPGFIELSKIYDDSYVEFDNYDAINVDRTEDIPLDYYGVMGVPITFLEKWNKNQFYIVGLLNDGCYIDEEGLKGSNGLHMTDVDGNKKYARILIRRKS